MSGENAVAQASTEATLYDHKTSLPEVTPQTESTSEANVESTQTTENKVTTDEAAVETTSNVPEKYDLKLPEGSLLKPADLEKISSYAKEKGLSTDQAQMLLDQRHSAITEYDASQKNLLKTTAEGWMTESKNDKELGGDAFAKNAELAKRVVDRFGTEAFKNALNETKLGNHPELLRVFTRIGKAMAEDTLIVPGSPAGGKSQSMEELFYGSTTTKE